MTDLSAALKKFLNNGKQMAFWRNRGELQALRGMCLAIGSAAAVIVTVALAAAGVSSVLCTACLTCSGGIFLPASIYIADRISKRQIANMQPADLGARHRLVRLQYDEECIMIENMSLDDKTKKKFRIDAFDKFLKKSEEIDTLIVSRTLEILPAEDTLRGKRRISDRSSNDTVDAEELD